MYGVEQLAGAAIYSGYGILSEQQSAGVFMRRRKPWHSDQSQFPMHQYFENSTTEFYSRETLFTPISIKLSPSLFVNTMPHQYI
jgi:hypothetical protein